VPESDHEETPSPNQEVNLFVALKPNRVEAMELYQATNRLCAHMGVRGTQRPPAILHVTLFSIGSCRGRIPSEFLEPMKAALATVRFPAFDLTFDHAMSFGSSAVNAPFVFLGSDDLIGAVALRLAARCALLVKGFRVPQRSGYTPHLTLLYGRQHSFPISVPPFSWRAHNFQLVESWRGKTKHVELGRWPLREPAG
jgi:2'-5' RNA ligase